jgi:NADPH:quinone reductase-like Zn-dependent oxidoreductase
VGLFAVELARALGARVVAAGRDRERTERLRERGAETVLTFDQLPEGLFEAAPAGADLVLDLVGGEQLPRLLASLAERGRLVLVGLMAGASAEIDLQRLLRRRLELRGSVLRPRSRAEKADLVAGFLAFAAERLARRELVPAIDRVFPFAEIAAAYRHLERGRPFGKVVVTMGRPVRKRAPERR